VAVTMVADPVDRCLDLIAAAFGRRWATPGQAAATAGKVGLDATLNASADLASLAKRVSVSGRVATDAARLPVNQREEERGRFIHQRY
jgi:hypothetical protein